MEIEVKIKSSDVLTEDEIRDIVSDEIRKLTKEYFINNEKHGASNMAFYIKENVLKGQIDEHIEEIKSKFKEQLYKFEFSSYDVHKNNLVDKMMVEQIKENEPKIKAKAQNEIDKQFKEDYLESYTVAEKIAEVYRDVVIEAIQNKIEG